MRQPVRVVLADDHDAFVEGLGMVLSAERDLKVVALAGDGASVLQAGPRTGPSGTTTPSCCCAACRSASGRSWP
jgi:DNA-binding NarL/FixJ family response regulator